MIQILIVSSLYYNILQYWKKQRQRRGKFMKDKLESYGNFISDIIYKLTHNMSDDELFAFIKNNPVLINLEVKSTERQLEKCSIDMEELEKSRIKIRARIDEQIKKNKKF